MKKTDSRKAETALPTPYLALLSFFSGFHIMVLEMVAFRILQTTFGSSIFVTGVLLTLIMVALAAGYFIGGYRAHQRGIRDLLGGILAGTGWILVFLVILRAPILDWGFHLRSSFVTSYFINIVPVSLVTLLLFAVPMTVLGSTTPYLVAHFSRQNDALAGLIVGRLMALSTVGSILGTIAASFWLIPVFGVNTTLVAVLAMISLLLVYGFYAIRQMVFSAISLLLLVLTASSSYLSIPDKSTGNVIYETESYYGSIRVEEGMNAGRKSYVYVPSRVYFHSEFYPDEPLDSQYPIGYFALGTALDKNRYLVLGVAGGTALTQLALLNRNYDLTGVEIDPVSIDIARRFFAVPDSVKLVADDARMFLQNDKSQYDFILVDLFANDFIPPHCISKEFFTLVRERLAPHGVVVINSNMPEIWASPDNVADFPGKHLHSTLFSAGFKSLYHDDTFGAGFVYAFAQTMNEETLLHSLQQASINPAIDEHIRASLSATALRVVRIPDSRSSEKPFTDEWTPEPLLQARGNDNARITAALEIPDNQLSALATAYLNLQKSDDSTESRALARENYCSAIRTTAQQATLASRNELARYFLPVCHDEALNSTLAGMTRGLELLNNDQGKKALPYLQSAMQTLL